MMQQPEMSIQVSLDRVLARARIRRNRATDEAEEWEAAYRELKENSDYTIQALNTENAELRAELETLRPQGQPPEG